MTMDNRVMVAAAKTMMAMVERGGRPMTLKQLKAEALPRSSWEHFANVCLAGHCAGVLVMSRIDMSNVYGTPEQTGEIASGNATFHWVKPAGWLG